MILSNVLKKSKLQNKMTRLKWKVCGLRDNVEEVSTLEPDYLGFIFYPKSPRFVGEDFRLSDSISQTSEKVGVFVNASTDFVEDTVRKFALDFAQIHGDESADYCKDLSDRGLKVIKAFQVDKEFDFAALDEYEPVVDYFLFDTKTSHYGGSGSAFDWSILRKYVLEKTYFLSGGIGLDNLEELRQVDLSKVRAVDVNSKFEVRPGLKSIEKLEELKDALERVKKL